MNKTLKTTDCCYTCVYVNCIRTYIYKRVIGLSMSNRGIQQTVLVIPTKF